MKRRLRVLFASSLLCLMTACSLPLKMVPELEPNVGQTRILSKFSWIHLAYKHRIESVADRSMVSIKEVDHETDLVLRRHGMRAFDVSITGRNTAGTSSESDIWGSDIFSYDLFSSDLGFDLSLDASPVELLMPEQVAAIIEGQVSPPSIGHLLIDFFGAFITQGQSLLYGFNAQYLQSIEVAEKIQAAGLYADGDGSAIRRRLYLRAPELQFNAIGKLLLVVLVDNEQHRLVYCLTRQASLCNKSEKATAHYISNS